MRALWQILDIDFSILMVLTARKNRSGWALRTKEAAKGPFLRAELALPPCICSGIWFANIKSDPMPIEINEKLPAGFGRPWKRPSRGWGAANPASHKWLAPCQAAVRDGGHTLRPTHSPHELGQHRVGQTPLLLAKKWASHEGSPGVERLKVNIFGVF